MQHVEVCRYDLAYSLLYARAGQLIFYWDRLKNFLIPVGNKETSRKCHKM